ncbi:MAG: pyruvate, phosphate dikinase [Candidatus Krumholzibacteria bacterium]|nr:pyruvate, phosphate dikinase [Candidatus Krumholzibacteria bacterium]
MSDKFVYFFGDGEAEGGANMKPLLGGKGAGLAEMTGIGIPVPAGFTVSTEVCTYFMEHDGAYPEGLDDQVRAGVSRVEKIMGGKFGDVKNTLLLSVRSGSRVSMPGMMDTVLNLGLNDVTVQGLIEKTGNPRFAYDSYRRFIQMYSDVVMGVDAEHFEKLLEEKREAAGAELDNELSAEQLKELVEEYKQVVEKHAGKSFPLDPWDQLWGGIAAVFRSWNVPRAVSYRNMHSYPDHWGTAVNVQSMVFGNMGENCATGVAFTRDPATGEKRFYGEYLVNAQGEDVVAGIRTPLPINTHGSPDNADQSLEVVMPDLYKELDGYQRKVEKHYRDMQDIEFTIQEGKLWMLQTRSGKRTGKSAVHIAVDMVDEGLIDEKTAVGRVEPEQLEQLLHPMIDTDVDVEPFAKGLPASPGAASGKVVFSVADAVRKVSEGDDVILVRTETSPEDIDGMKVSRAILTTRGGMTSHAAVVARGMGKCCVVGCTELVIDYEKQRFSVGRDVFKAGDSITLEGSTGSVYAGILPTVEPKLDDAFRLFMTWVDSFRKLGVRTNADTPTDSTTARSFGAEGIGLCRTEHMFFGEERIDVVRQMIIAETTEERKEALEKILPMQREDFVGVFKAMDGYPVTVRLLDPPLHEFLPDVPEEVEALAKRLGIGTHELRMKIQSLHEFNPMLGHRGCRLGISYPEIYEVQVRALFEAACIAKKDGVDVRPEVMVPLVGFKSELAPLREMIVRLAGEVLEEQGVTIDYLVGTMIEVPRAAVTAAEIAEVADFFSFGTNDLTQMTCGFSRDDSGRFIGDYLDEGILKNDPFETLDTSGVGELIRWAVENGRKTRPDLKLGICGEHGGDPASVHFCHEIGLDYVSCSPYRVPIAKLAAAQAALNDD